MPVLHRRLPPAGQHPVRRGGAPVLRILPRGYHDPVPDAHRAPPRAQRRADQGEQERRLDHLVERFTAIDFLAPLGREGLRELAARVGTAAYGRDEPIVREAEAGSDLYVIDRGEVSVRVGGTTAAPEIARLRAGDFFGEMSLMTGEPRRATVKALGDVATLRVDKDSFREVLARYPKVVEEIARVLAARQTALEAQTSGPGGAAPAEANSHALVRLIRSFFRL